MWMNTGSSVSFLPAWAEAFHRLQGRCEQRMSQPCCPQRCRPRCLHTPNLPRGPEGLPLMLVPPPAFDPPECLSNFQRQYAESLGQLQWLNKITTWLMMTDSLRCISSCAVLAANVAAMLSAAMSAALSPYSKPSSWAWGTAFAEQVTDKALSSAQKVRHNHDF